MNQPVGEPGAPFSAPDVVEDDANAFATLGEENPPPDPRAALLNASEHPEVPWRAQQNAQHERTCLWQGAALRPSVDSNVPSTAGVEPLAQDEHLATGNVASIHVPDPGARAAMLQALQSPILGDIRARVARASAEWPALTAAEV